MFVTLKQILSYRLLQIAIVYYQLSHGLGISTKFTHPATFQRSSRETFCENLALKTALASSRSQTSSYLRLRGGMTTGNKFPTSAPAAEDVAEDDCGISCPIKGCTVPGMSINMHGILDCSSSGESLNFEAGEFHFHDTVEIEQSRHIAHAPPMSRASLTAVQAAIANATANLTEPIACTTVVRIWGHWSLLNGSNGSFTNVTTVSQCKDANYPTMDAMGGPWLFSHCGLRSVGGTALLLYGAANATLTHCAVGSLAGTPKAAYGVTATDDSTATLRRCVFHRCRYCGARFVRRAVGQVVDCDFDKCILQGAKNVLSRGRPCPEPPPPPDGHLTAQSAVGGG